MSGKRLRLERFAPSWKRFVHIGGWGLSPPAIQLFVKSRITPASGADRGPYVHGACYCCFVSAVGRRMDWLFIVVANRIVCHSAFTGIRCIEKQRSPRPGKTRERHHCRGVFSENPGYKFRPPARSATAPLQETESQEEWGACTRPGSSHRHSHLPANPHDGNEPAIAGA